MAEVQRTTVSGEMTQRFIEFVMMQAQNAAMFLGQIPHPQTGRGQVDLETARLFIDQLEMIQEKTRGNLTAEEGKILTNALSNLQMAYVEIAARTGHPDAFSGRGRAMPEPEPEEPPLEDQQPPAAEIPQAAVASDAAPAAPSAPAAPDEESHESKRRFVKSYGP